MPFKFPIYGTMNPVAGGGAGFAEVGGGTQRATKVVSGVDSTTLAYPGNVLNGSLLIVGGGVFISGGAPASITVTDTLSTSYTTLLSSAIGTNRSKVWISYGLASSGGANTVTVNPAGASADFSFSIDEFSGANATPLDVNGGSATASDLTPANDIITATANDLVLGVTSWMDVGLTITPNAAYTQIGKSEDASTSQPHSFVFKIVTTATTYNVDWTLSSVSEWVAFTSAFKPA